MAYTQRDWYNLLNAEVRRQTRNAKLPERQHSLVPMVTFTRMRVAAPQAIEYPTMSLPPCLCRGNTEASKELRREAIGSRDFWVTGKQAQQAPTMPARKQGRFACLFV